MLKKRASWRERPRNKNIRMGSHWPLLKTYQHLHRVKTHEGGQNPGIFKVHKSWFAIGLGNFWIPASGDHSRQHLNINQWRPKIGQFLLVRRHFCWSIYTPVLSVKSVQDIKSTTCFYFFLCPFLFLPPLTGVNLKGSP